MYKRQGVNPGIIGMIRDDLVRVLSRYAQIDAGAMELRLIRPDEGGQQAFLITAAFPVQMCIRDRSRTVCFR